MRTVVYTPASTDDAHITMFSRQLQRRRASFWGRDKPYHTIQMASGSINEHKTYLAHSINDHTSLIDAISKMSTFGDLVSLNYRPRAAFVARTEQTGRVIYYSCIENVLEVLCRFPGLGSGFDLVTRSEVESATVLRSNFPPLHRKSSSNHAARAVLLHVFDQFGSHVPFSIAVHDLMTTISTMFNRQLAIRTTVRPASFTSEITRQSSSTDEDLEDEEKENEEPINPKTCAPTRRCHRINCVSCNKHLSDLCVVMLDGSRDKLSFQWVSFVKVPPSLLAM